MLRVNALANVATSSEGLERASDVDISDSLRETASEREILSENDVEDGLGNADITSANGVDADADVDESDNEGNSRRRWHVEEPIQEHPRERVGSRSKHRKHSHSIDPAPVSERVPRRWWVIGLVVSSAMCVAILSPIFNMPVYEPIVAVILAMLVSVLAVRMELLPYTVGY